MQEDDRVEISYLEEEEEGGEKKAVKEAEGLDVGPLSSRDGWLVYLAGGD